MVLVGDCALYHVMHMNCFDYDFWHGVPGIGTRLMI